MILLVVGGSVYLNLSLYPPVGAAVLVSLLRTDLHLRRQFSGI
jgi:hypothetical protein